MMRPITCLSLMVALGAGLYLYQVKHRAQLLDRDINRTVKLTEAARERIGLLKAEWGLLADPQRLGALAAHHLQLQPLAPSQFVRLEDLAARLPAPVTISTASAPVDTATVVAAAQPPAAIPVVESLEPAKATLPAPPRPSPPRPNLARPTHPAMVASLTKPHRVYAAVVPVYAPSELGVHAPTVQTASAITPTLPPVPYVGSALGMARTGLAPPVPVAANAGYPGAR